MLPPEIALEHTHKTMFSSHTAPDQPESLLPLSTFGTESFDAGKRVQHRSLSHDYYDILLHSLSQREWKRRRTMLESLPGMESWNKRDVHCWHGLQNIEYVSCSNEPSAMV